MPLPAVEKPMFKGEEAKEREGTQEKNDEVSPGGEE